MDMLITRSRVFWVCNSGSCCSWGAVNPSKVLSLRPLRVMMIIMCLMEDLRGCIIYIMMCTKFMWKDDINSKNLYSPGYLYG